MTTTAESTTETTEPAKTPSTEAHPPRVKGPANTPPKRGPESKFYESLKDVRVQVSHAAGTSVGIIAWVDKYSIGLRSEPKADPKLIYKHAIRLVERA